jgi:hypothetical protein
MCIRVNVNLGAIRFNKVFSGASEAEVFRQFREEAIARLPWVQRQGARLLDNRAFIRTVVQKHNELTSSNEPIPSDIAGFLAFGRRVGYVTVV